MDVAWSRAVGYQQVVHECVVLDASSDEIMLRCPFDFQAVGSAKLGLGPFAGSWTITIGDDGIVSASSYWNHLENGFATEVAEPFFVWLRATHPNDLVAMYNDSTHSEPAWTHRSIELWEQRTREYIDAASGRGS
jgi:hypothetical protein